MQEQTCTIMEDQGNLITLRKLTENLPKFSDLIRTRAPGYVEMETKEGNSFGINLLNQNEVSVAKWFGSKGTVFQTHAHSEKEWIIVYCGSVNVIYEDKILHLEKGDFCFHEPGVQHGATFDEDCWYLAITIPSSVDWPK